MRIALTLVALLVLAGGVHANTFSWSEDFQGTLSANWQLTSNDYNFTGVIDDPTDPGNGNKVLSIDTWDDGGAAYADVLESAFHGLDGSKDVTASFRFNLQDGDASLFTILGTKFSAVADYQDKLFGGTYYGTGGEDPFQIPVGEWINFKYVFRPGDKNGVGASTTHDVYMNDAFMGTYNNVEISSHTGSAFFLGDDEPDGVTYGKGLWDDFQVTGTAKDVPEPGSILSLIGGIAGIGGFAIRRRQLAA
jgi:hypothetical protein